MRSCWPDRTPSSARACGHRPQERLLLAALRRARPGGRSGRRSGGRRSRSGPRRRSAPSPRPAGRRPPMPMFQWPQSPCQPPRLDRIGAVATARSRRRRPAAGCRPAPRTSRSAVAAQPGPEAAARPGAARWCRPGRPPRASRRAARPASPGVRGSVASGEITRTSSPAHWPWWSSSRDPEGARVARADRGQRARPRVGPARPSGRCDPPWRSPGAVPSRSKTWSTGFWLTRRVPSRTPTRTSVPKQPARWFSIESAPGSVAGTRSIGHRASAKAREWTERSSRLRTGPGERGAARAQPPEHAGRGRARRPGPAAAGAARSGRGRRRGAASRCGAGCG